MHRVYTYYFNNQRETGVARLIPNKVDFKTKNITIIKRDYFITVQVSIIPKDITVLNDYVLKKDLKIYEAKSDKSEKRNR